MQRPRLGRHAKRKDMHVDRLLAAGKGGLDDEIDFLNSLVCHRIAADRDACPMNHQEAACPSLRAVIGVGKAEVEGQVITASRVQLRSRYAVETFRALAISFAQFGTKRA
jgi:hypothetical protein